VHSTAYDDWPKILCVPRYTIDLKSGDCAMCEAGLYCPMRSDYWHQCPPYLTSRLARAELSDCWCAAGLYGKPGVQQ
jgi:hypothetical protein